MQINATYYTQPASAGSIITDATRLCADGIGYPHTPGVDTIEQIGVRRKVVEADGGFS